MEKYGYTLVSYGDAVRSVQEFLKVRRDTARAMLKAYSAGNGSPIALGERVLYYINIGPVNKWAFGR